MDPNFRVLFISGLLRPYQERDLSHQAGFILTASLAITKGDAMSKVAIVTDSTAYIPNNLLREYNITVTPQIVIWGEETFRDGIDILPDEFYKRLEKAKIMPTTSQVSIVAMKSAFEGLVEQGYDVLGIFLSSKLSGTMQSAQQALEMLPKIAGKIAIIDSYSTSMAMGFHVLTAARAAQAGETLPECRKLAEKAREHTGVYFVVDTLEFLRRGGRIGGAQAMLGSALNIKPLLELREGRIESVEKVRTKSKAIDRMIELVVERVAGRTPVRLATLHANAEAEAKSALEAAAAQLNPVEEILASVSPAIGTHAGPGTVGLAFMAGM
jgi:DegV family protein with EDD domain